MRLTLLERNWCVHIALTCRVCPALKDEVFPVILWDSHCDVILLALAWLDRHVSDHLPANLHEESRVTRCKASRGLSSARHEPGLMICSRKVCVQYCQICLGYLHEKASNLMCHIRLSKTHAACKGPNDLCHILIIIPLRTSVYQDVMNVGSYHG